MRDLETAGTSLALAVWWWWCLSTYGTAPMYVHARTCARRVKVRYGSIARACRCASLRSRVGGCVCGGLRTPTAAAPSTCAAAQHTTPGTHCSTVQYVRYARPAGIPHVRVQRPMALSSLRPPLHVHERYGRSAAIPPYDPARTSTFARSGYHLDPCVKVEWHVWSQLATSTYMYLISLKTSNDREPGCINPLTPITLTTFGGLGAGLEGLRTSWIHGHWMP